MFSLLHIFLSFFSYYFATPWTCGDGGLAHYEANPICPTFGLGDHTIVEVIDCDYCIIKMTSVVILCENDVALITICDLIYCETNCEICVDKKLI